MNRPAARFLWLVVVLVGAAPSRGEDFDALLAEFERADQAWHEQHDSLKPGADGSIRVSSPPPTFKYYGRFRALADAQRGTPEAVPTLLWLIENAQFAGHGDLESHASACTAALKQLATDHARDARVLDALPSIASYTYAVPRDALLDFYERIGASKLPAAARARLLFDMGRLYDERDLHAAPSDQDLRTAVKYYRRVVKEYADEDAAELAARALFACENLRLGMTAPELTGPRLDGEGVIKLSQFRGQVVMLKFWGFW